MNIRKIAFQITYRHFVMWYTKLYNSVDHYAISTRDKQELKLWFMLIITGKINFTPL